MKRYGHGLVLGAFCPPHAAHHRLVRTAHERCERLTVLVRGCPDDPLPLAERVAWMREIHPEALVAGTTGDDPLGAVREPVDAVFTPERPAEDVLADPAAHWDLLEAPVRAALTRRVVVLGAGHTGTTTLARALAAHYRARGGVWARTRYVPEYAPEYRAARDGAPLRSGDFPLIALGQAEREEEAARDGSPVLVCDTDAFTVTIRHERQLGTRSADTGEIAARARHHLWLLTDHRGVESPVPEGREEAADPEGDERLRSWTTARLLTQLTRTGRPTAVLTGPHEERLAAAVAAVDALLATPPERR
ncbi:AAA family ATPase [Streptomyces showdoensis]|uniref:Transcriptional regulator n=1 Tax=Streptomyces showdoensis TaxID=68268 RepID=A0A2P2GK17_STREW|nr:AAA family ATPase [Streptomyces showdoensis]KKZ71854.1 transcriptional regulator [Streptomyces showdoensis]